jgi:hypothetical protein
MCCVSLSDIFLTHPRHDSLNIILQNTLTQNVHKFIGKQFWLIELANNRPNLYKEQFIVTKLLYVRLRTHALAVYVLKPVNQYSKLFYINTYICTHTRTFIA